MVGCGGVRALLTSQLRGCRRQERELRGYMARTSQVKQTASAKALGQASQHVWNHIVQFHCLACVHVWCYVAPFSAGWVAVNLLMDGDVRTCLFTHRTAVFSQRCCSSTEEGCHLFMRKYTKICLWKCPYVHMSGYLHRSDMWMCT